MKLSEGRHIIKFEASWCKPCKAMQPILDAVLDEVGAGTNAWRIDVEKHPELANEYRIKSYPTLVFVQDGTERMRYTGSASSKVDVTNFIKVALA